MTACPCSSAGPWTAAASLPCPSSARATRRRASRTSACTACRSTTTGRAGMHWHLHKDGAHFFQKYKERGERMPVAVALGCDPAVTYASTAPLPEGMWEMLFAGFLRGKRRRDSQGHAERPGRARRRRVRAGRLRRPRRGPRGRPLRRPYGLLLARRTSTRSSTWSASRGARIRSIRPPSSAYRPRRTAGWPRPPSGSSCPSSSRCAPRSSTCRMPLEGVFHNCVIVSIKKRFPGQARKVMNFMWGMGQMMYTKLIVVVDEDVNPSDVSAVAWRAFNNIDARRDLVLVGRPAGRAGPLVAAAALRHAAGRRRHAQGPGRGAHAAVAGAARRWTASGQGDARWEEYGMTEPGSIGGPGRSVGANPASASTGGIWGGMMGDAVIIRHTLFSLPFAVVAVLLETGGRPPCAGSSGSSLRPPAGRNAANALNRVIDADIDERNPGPRAGTCPRAAARRNSGLRGRHAGVCSSSRPPCSTRSASPCCRWRRYW